MKTKNILGLVAIVAIAVAMAFNITVSNKKADTASLLALRNVEALASGESGGGHTCTVSSNCYHGSLVYGTVSCSGVVACRTGFEYVNCDGNISTCV
jgi:hypothetical protein